MREGSINHAPLVINRLMIARLSAQNPKCPDAKILDCPPLDRADGLV